MWACTPPIMTLCKLSLQICFHSLGPQVTSEHISVTTVSGIFYMIFAIHIYHFARLILLKGVKWLLYCCIYSSSFYVANWHFLVWECQNFFAYWWVFWLFWVFDIYKKINEFLHVIHFIELFFFLLGAYINSRTHRIYGQYF